MDKVSVSEAMLSWKGDRRGWDDGPGVVDVEILGLDRCERSVELGAVHQGYGAGWLGFNVCPWRSYLIRLGSSAVLANTVQASDRVWAPGAGGAEQAPDGMYSGPPESVPVGEALQSHWIQSQRYIHTAALARPFSFFLYTIRNYLFTLRK